MTLLMRDQEHKKKGEDKMLTLIEKLVDEKRFDDIVLSGKLKAPVPCSGSTVHDRCVVLQNDLQILRFGHSSHELLDRQNGHRCRLSGGLEAH